MDDKFLFGLVGIAAVVCSGCSGESERSRNTKYVGAYCSKMLTIRLVHAVCVLCHTCLLFPSSLVLFLSAVVR